MPLMSATGGSGTLSDSAPAGVELVGVSKQFSGQYALSDVNVSFRSGKVTALLGQNGSGKSTLIKILAGYYEPDPGGRLCVDGEPLSTPVNPRAVHARGVRFVHQDLGLVGGMSVADNFALEGGYRGTRTLAPVNDPAHRTRAHTVLAALGLDIDVRRAVRTLDSTEQTMVAIARCVQDQVLGSRSSLTLVLDEPTATLPYSEVGRVFEILLRARSLGTTIIYVTHRLDEVTRLADDVVVLRDGRLAEYGSLADHDAHSLARAVTGGEAAVEGQRPSTPATDTARARLEVHGLTGNIVAGFDMTVREGEILGLAGFLGSGVRELVQMLGGAKPPHGGEVVLDGAPVRGRHPLDFIRRGISYVSSDRRGESSIPRMSLRENLTLGRLDPFWRRGLLRFAAERREATRLISQFDIRPPRIELQLSRFSGGNQQKAVLARCIRLEPAVLVVDEPTQGVDVGARRQIHQTLRAIAESGTSMVVASTDLEELLELTDRVIVLDRGRTTANVISSRTSLQELTRYCNGEQQS